MMRARTTRSLRFNLRFRLRPGFRFALVGVVAAVVGPVGPALVGSCAGAAEPPPPSGRALFDVGAPSSPAAARPARLAVSPRALVFDTPGQVAVVTLRNEGDSPLRLGSFRTLIAGAGDIPDFSVDHAGGQTLLPGETLPVRVAYRPLSRGGARQSFGALLIDQGVGSGITGVALRAGPGSALLSWLIFSPLFGIPLLLFCPRGRDRLLRSVALAATVVPLALSGWMLLTFDPGFSAAHGNFGFQFVQHVVWMPAFNVEYYVGVDGLSVGLVALTALISTIAVLASWSMSTDGHAGARGYFALLLLLETGMLGVFAALDLFLFYVFWEVVLVPMYFLIGLWGGKRREYAAIKFFLYTLVGAVLVLLAVLALYFGSKATYLVDGTPAAHTLDIVKLAHDNDFGAHPALFGRRFAHVVWVLLFIGFAIKIPVVPLHTWLPDAHVEAPTAVSVILAGVLLKMGTYGMLRVGWAVLPEATRWGAPAVAVVGSVAVIYGGLCALAQKDLKALVAYSSIGHMGFCLLGMAALTPLGIEGAVFQMISHGIVSASLFLLVGVLYERTGERGLDAFGGVAVVMPRYAGFFGLAFFASLGLPGLSGFIGELMALLGAFGPYRVATVVAAAGLVVSAAYNLVAIRRIQFGELPERWRPLLTGRDLDAREWLSLLPLALLIVGLGFFPRPLLAVVATGAEDLLRVMGLPAAGLGGEF
ncbi:MAG: NADH-quinone oxidoreductase subunit M [Pseudomonadota bacterium]